MYSFFTSSLFIQSIYIAFIVIAAIQVLYYLIFFSQFIFTRKKNTIVKPTPVSIIICAKNEYKNLQQNLPIILQQEYDKYEVIVVNDNSDDNTSEYLNVLKASYTHLRVIDILNESRTFSGKRLPLSLGLKGASYEWCLLTDADCQPLSNKWLQQMQANFNDTKSIVLGYAPHQKTKGFLNRCIRFETFFTAFQYLSFAMIGLPYMGVGRNMAYRKNLFFDNKGYVPNPKLISGDDDLFINKVATGNNTIVEYNHNTFMYSPAKTTWENWWIQKQRHVSTGTSYKLIHKIMLGTYSLSHLLFYLLLALLLVCNFQWQVVLAIFGGRLLLQGVIMGIAMKKLKEIDLLLFVPLFDILQVVYNVCLAPSLIVKKVSRWK